MVVHFKCRGGLYPFSEIQRLVFADALVPWSTQFENYAPANYSSPSLRNKPWADRDVDDTNFHPKWNALDGKVNRVTHTGIYNITHGKPQNPEGRTGLCGRGILGRWGPNHAADPIVTRWKRKSGEKILHPTSKLPILQFCGIQRKDCNEWALPGGMIDPGEHVSATLKREFLEEALNSLEATPGQAETDRQMVTDFFRSGEEIYKGYVDDPRNTDNAWMETVAVNFHDETGASVGRFPLRAGDDAKEVRWLDVDRNLSLYASHSNFIQHVAKLHKAHW